MNRTFKIIPLTIVFKNNNFSIETLEAFPTEFTVTLESQS